MTYFKSILGGIGLHGTGLMAVPVLTVVVLVASLHGAVAVGAGDTDAGHKIAVTWCGNCHVVGREQQSGASNGAPTFTAIADMKTTTWLGLHAFLQTPHHRMPDMQLTRDEMDDLTAYILSLRQGAGTSVPSDANGLMRTGH